MQRNCCFGEFMKKYYTFKDVTFVFTDLVKKNSLVEDITFVDFKLKNYKIMNNYCKLMKNIHLVKDKSSTKLTASCSLIKEVKHFKEQQMQIKKITKRSNNMSKKQKQNNSHQYTNLLVKNIQKMLKNYKGNTILLDQQKIHFKHSNKHNQQLTKSIKQITQERLHTTPQNSHLDNYGLEEFRNNHNKKSVWSLMIDPNDSKILNLDKYCENGRHQTQYDTQNIYSHKIVKNKQEFSKKSITKFKSLSFKKKSVVERFSKGKGQKLIKK